MEEKWKDIEGYEGSHKVSSFGRVKSLDRTIKYTRVIKSGVSEVERIERGRIMKSRFGSDGYSGEAVGLRKEGEQTEFRVDMLVAKAFLDNPHNTVAVKHIDGNIFNNKMNNLKYDDGIESLDGEVWRDILGYEGYYQISNLGRVKGLAREIIKGNGYKAIYCEKLMKPQIMSGYFSVILGKGGGGTKNLGIHKLIGIAFIPNPFNKPQINHIDGNKLNNSISNLEWCTASENMRHAYDTGLVKSRTRAVMGENLKTGKIVSFNIIEKAVRYLQKNGYPRAGNTNIGSCCKGKISYAYGHKWKYQDKSNLNEN